MVKYARYESYSKQETNLYQQIITGLFFLVKLIYITATLLQVYQYENILPTFKASQCKFLSERDDYGKRVYESLH